MVSQQRPIPVTHKVTQGDTKQVCSLSSEVVSSERRPQTKAKELVDIKQGAAHPMVACVSGNFPVKWHKMAHKVTQSRTISHKIGVF